MGLKFSEGIIRTTNFGLKLNVHVQYNMLTAEYGDDEHRSKFGLKLNLYIQYNMLTAI